MTIQPLALRWPERAVIGGLVVAVMLFGGLLAWHYFLPLHESSLTWPVQLVPAAVGLASFYPYRRWEHALSKSLALGAWLYLACWFGITVVVGLRADVTSGIVILVFAPITFLQTMLFGLLPGVAIGAALASTQHRIEARPLLIVVLIALSLGLMSRLSPSPDFLASHPV